MHNGVLHVMTRKDGRKVILCDLDDFCEDTRSLADLRRLDELRAVIPTFKATLFTIGGRCSKGFIADIKASRPWLDLVAHGWTHQTNRECEQWNADTCREVLAASRIMGLTTRGFKAPGWQISDGCYQALFSKRGTGSQTNTITTRGGLPILRHTAWIRAGSQRSPCF